MQFDKYDSSIWALSGNSQKFSAPLHPIPTNIFQFYSRLSSSQCPYTNQQPTYIFNIFILMQYTQMNNTNNPNWAQDYQTMNSDRPYPPQNNYQNTQPYPDNQYNQYPNSSYSNQPYNINDDQPPIELVKPNNGAYQDSPIVPGNDQPNYEPTTILGKDLATQARKSFIKKVYMVLGMQLLITVAMCFLSYYCRPFLLFQVQNQWLMWVCFALMIISQIVIFCFPAGRRHPINIILLLVFTLCESYFVSYICALVSYQNNSSQVVVVAAVMTFAIVFALTVYAILTPTDFTIMWGIVVVILMAMIMLGIFSIFSWSPFLNTLYCSLGVILFGIYLVIDTQLIVGGKRLELSMDDYVVGALLLYIDIITIFLYLIQIFGRR